MRQALIVFTALVGVLLVPVPSFAAPVQTPPTNRKCKDPGTPARTLPWHQQSFDPRRIDSLTGGEGVRVAVVDSGVDATHPQLKGRVQPGRDLLFPGGGPGDWDCTGHGTAVASIIAGGGEAGMVFRGYARGVQVLPLVVGEQDPDKGEPPAGTADRIAAAVQAAVTDKAQVINISFAVYEDVPALRDAIKQAVASDVVVVASVGSTSPEQALAGRTPYPAAYPGVIGVGSIGPSGERSSSSPVGPWVDLVAPGEQILAATRGGGYAAVQGTGFATPFVSAAAALIRARTPGLPAKAVAERLYATADPSQGSGAGQGYGRGIVDAYRAVAEYPGATAAGSVAAVPVHTGDKVDPTRRWQIQVALIAAAATVSAVLIATAAAVWLPRGRRRRWIPGRAAPLPTPVPADGNRRLFDDLEES
ncbi:S8 family serine peptidase [Dactylosporangium siamense]|uniref:Type VII secretion-associated serine protease n=1 Tax=Dactylosporangium siamense TaxID=685454 RepID=A0A919PQV3_9ACTN|nr:S8 family serine peptidase [Dactylosporangium siamense]GIG46653.1 type VII secretion-associated serine protease [Dactylosporangium siamense]